MAPFRQNRRSAPSTANRKSRGNASVIARKSFCLLAVKRKLTERAYAPFVARLKDRVDEWGQRRSLNGREQRARDHENDDDRQKPQLLPCSHESPKFTQNLEHLAP